jgi:DegV family protein with EDD domain
MEQKSIAIVTDSTADIPDSITIDNPIHIVNNLIIIEGHSFEDRRELSRQDFYERLPNMKSFPTTATASSGTYQKLYGRLLQQGVDFIFSIHASSKLSGIYNAACLAAQTFGERIWVIDSENISLGLGYQVLAAAEAVKQGLSVENILGVLNNIRRRIHVVAMLDTLEYVRRSGRVTWVRARLGDVLRIKPLLEVKNGQVISLGEARTYRKGVARLIETLKNIGPLEHLAVLHTNAENEAHEFLKLVTNRISEIPLLVNVTTVIGSHVGPNGLGFVAINRELGGDKPISG